jgi:hypothetical protein
LLIYSTDELSSTEKSSVRNHLDSCDFCSAELVLLIRHPPKPEVIKTPVMPGHLLLLAKALLTQHSPLADILAEASAFEITA